MKRILVLSPRDWLHPRAGAFEHYLREVFTRIALAGNYVALYCCNYRPDSPFGRKAAQLQIVDGVQIARLGSYPFYRMLVSMVLRRLCRNGGKLGPFDVIVDCINGTPLPIADYVATPVVPLVFRLGAGITADPEPPGPIVAVGENARCDLVRAGVMDDFIMSAPYAADGCGNAPGPCADRPTLAVRDTTPGCLRKALKALRREGCDLGVEQVGAKRGGMHDLPVVYHDALDEDTLALYQRAWFGYCGVGSEWHAPSLGACGRAVVCPDTPAARDFVKDGRNGLLHEPGNSKDLARQLLRVIRDDVLRKRLSSAALERARSITWDKTTGVVLAAIESVSQQCCGRAQLNTRGSREEIER